MKRARRDKAFHRKTARRDAVSMCNSIAGSLLTEAIIRNALAFTFENFYTAVVQNKIVETVIFPII